MKYQNEHEMIVNAIKNNNFLQYMDEELQKEIESKIHDAEWRFKGKNDAYINTVKKNIRIETTEKFKKMYTSDYPKFLMLPEKNKKFIMFLLGSIIKKNSEKITKDDECIKKMLNLNDYPEFYKLIDTNSEYKFVCKISQMLKDLEFPKNYTFDRIYYWRFEKTLCTTIKRDREWFAKSLPKFEKTWKNIEFLRANKDCADILFKFIDDLPAKEIQHGKELKDNDIVEEFVNMLCNKKTVNYEKKIKEMITKYCKKMIK